jgi:hypothetical protein
MTRPNPNVRSKFEPLIPPAQRIDILLLLQNGTYSVSPGQGKFSFFFLEIYGIGTVLVRNCAPCILPTYFLPTCCH